MPSYISETDYFAAAHRMHASDYLQLLTTIYHYDPFFPLEHFFNSITSIKEKFLFYGDPTPDIIVDREKETIWYPDIEADDGSKIASHVSDEFDVILRKVIPVIITYVKNEERKWSKRDFNDKKQLLRQEIGELIEKDENKATIKKYPVIKNHLRPLLHLLEYRVKTDETRMTTTREPFFARHIDEKKLWDFREMLIDKKLIETISFKEFRKILNGIGEGTIKCKKRTGNSFAYLLRLLAPLTPYPKNVWSKAHLYFSGLPKNFRNSTGLNDENKEFIELAVKKLL
jgi:hypothetical protein